MPPSPIIKASVNTPLYRKLLSELALPEPNVIFKPGGGAYFGHVEPIGPGVITIYLGHDEFGTDQLRFAMHELSRTLIHETRHLWQWTNHKAKFWNIVEEGKPYNHKLRETDAFAFEDKQLARYGNVVRLRRHFPSSSFSRLAKTEAAVRQNV